MVQNYENFFILWNVHIKNSPKIGQEILENSHCALSTSAHRRRYGAAF